MGLEIVALTAANLDDAARLLAGFHRQVRETAPELQERFTTPDEVRPVLQQLIENPDTTGVAALRDGRMTGFLAGAIALPSPQDSMSLFVRPRSAVVGYGGCAVEPADGYELYRSLYAALAPAWTARGCFTHYVTVPADDRQALEAWSSLGFGQDLVSGVRDTGPVQAAGPAAAVEVHQAGPEEIGEVLRLITDLYRYHAGPPMFQPYLPETEADVRRAHEALLAGPTGAHWLAIRDGRAVGLQDFTPASVRSPLAIVEDSTYLRHGYTDAGARGGGVATALLDRSMVWARDAGYRYCTINWFSGNLLAARFWRRSGFRPLSYRLVRIVDERIAWAGGAVA